MKASVDAIASEAMQLPEDQRLTLAQRILSSVEPAAAPEIDATWDTEIQHRIARYDSNPTTGIPASQVFSDLDKKLRR